MLTTKQLATFLADTKSHLGDQPVKIRNQRSDKNKKRKQPDGEGESGDESKENESQVTESKKKLKTASTKSTTRKPCRNVKVPLRSRSVIDNSDEEERS